MASLIEICEGLATNLSGITGAQWSAYMLSNPTPPYGEIYAGDPRGQEPLVKYDGAFRRGLDAWHLTARVMVPFTSDIGAQQKLYAYCDSSGPTSVKEALEQDRKLGGIVNDLHVTECSGVGLYKPGNVAMLGAEWRILVLANGVTP